MADKPSKGLADIIAASTALSDIDGRAGLLFYRGYDIHQLAGPATFEEIAYLLQRGHPPTRGELAGYAAEIDAGREPAHWSPRACPMWRAGRRRWRRCAAWSHWRAPTIRWGSRGSPGHRWTGGDGRRGGRRRRLLSLRSRPGARGRGSRAAPPAGDRMLRTPPPAAGRILRTPRAGDRAPRTPPSAGDRMLRTPPPAADRDPPRARSRPARPSSLTCWCWRSPSARWLGSGKAASSTPKKVRWPWQARCSSARSPGWCCRNRGQACSLPGGAS